MYFLRNEIFFLEMKRISFSRRYVYGGLWEKESFENIDKREKYGRRRTINFSWRRSMDTLWSRNDSFEIEKRKGLFMLTPTWSHWRSSIFKTDFFLENNKKLWEKWTNRNSNMENLWKKLSLLKVIVKR